MASQKLTDLTAASGTGSGDKFYLVQSGVDKQIDYDDMPFNAPPLTTKGDIYTYDTSDQRLAVGGDGEVLSADSSEPTGLKWIAAGAGDMILSAIQTVTGLKTFEDAKFALRNVADTFSAFFTNANTADRTYTLQDKTGTIAHLDDITGTNSGTNTGDEVSASTTVEGIVELATVTEVQTGTDTTRAVTSEGIAKRANIMGFALGDETSDLAVATGVLTFQMPNYATTLTGVSVNVVTAPTGSVATFDINEGGTSVLSTKITIDAGEKTSETAATPPVISDSAIAADAIISVDVDAIGSTVAGAGAKVWIYFNKA